MMPSVMHSLTTRNQDESPTLAKNKRISKIVVSSKANKSVGQRLFEKRVTGTKLLDFHDFTKDK